jgi:hypothetical protein
MSRGPVCKNAMTATNAADSEQLTRESLFLSECRPREVFERGPETLYRSGFALADYGPPSSTAKTAMGLSEKVDR